MLDAVSLDQLRTFIAAAESLQRRAEAFQPQGANSGGLNPLSARPSPT